MTDTFTDELATRLQSQRDDYGAAATMPTIEALLDRPAPPARLGSTRPRRRTTTIALAAAAVMLLVVGVLALTRDDTQRVSTLPSSEVRRLAGPGTPFLLPPGGDAVAEFVFALALDHLRAPRKHAELVRAGEWVASGDFSFWRSPLAELAGKTMGIVGFGRIGRRVGELATGARLGAGRGPGPRVRHRGRAHVGTALRVRLPDARSARSGSGRGARPRDGRALCRRCRHDRPRWSGRGHRHVGRLTGGSAAGPRRSR